VYGAHAHGRKLALACRSHVELWDINSAKKIGTLRVPAFPITIQLSSYYMAFLCQHTDYISVWDMRADKRLGLFGHRQSPFRLHLLSNKLTSLSSKDGIKTWNLAGSDPSLCSFSKVVSPKLCKVQSSYDKLVATLETGDILVWSL